MLIHSDTLAPEHFARAVEVVNIAAGNAPGIGGGDLAVTVTPRRSSIAARAYEFHLGGAAHWPGRRSVTAYGHPAPGGFAFQAAFDEYGFILAELFDADPFAIVGRASRRTYEGRDHFDIMTGFAYDPAEVADSIAEYGEESYPYVRAARVLPGKTGYARFDGDDSRIASMAELQAARDAHAAGVKRRSTWVTYAPRDPELMRAQSAALLAAREAVEVTA